MGKFKGVKSAKITVTFEAKTAIRCQWVEHKKYHLSPGKHLTNPPKPINKWAYIIYILYLSADVRCCCHLRYWVTISRYHPPHLPIYFNC